MQLGFLRDNVAKVEELKQEAEALTADLNNFKINSSSRNLLGSILPLFFLNQNDTN